MISHGRVGRKTIATFQGFDNRVVLCERVIVGRRSVPGKFQHGPHDGNTNRVHDAVEFGQQGVTGCDGYQLMKARVQFFVFGPAVRRTHPFGKVAGLGQMPRGGVDSGIACKFWF